MRSQNLTNEMNVNHSGGNVGLRGETFVFLKVESYTIIQKFLLLNSLLTQRPSNVLSE